MPSTERGGAGVSLDEAIEHHRAGRLDEARAVYEALLADDRGNADALNLLGVLCAQQGDAERAETLFESAIASDPAHARAFGSLGNLRRMQGRMDDAVAAYRRAVELDPGRALSHFNLGSALNRTGKRDEAESHYRRALELDPSDPDTHINLALLLLDTGRPDDAIAMLEKGLELDRGNAEMLEKLGDLLRHKGDLHNAAEYFSRAMAADPSRRHLEHLAAAYRGDTDTSGSADYARYLFDNFADDYDDQLTAVLGYRVPQLLRKLVDEKIGSDARFGRGLDLGCGTGLTGMAFRDIVEAIDGVDVSAKMLDKARQRDVYTRLETAEVVEFLDAGDSEYDFFVAADVFVYIGDLAPVFAGIRKRAADGAVVLFTAESTNSADYRLNRTGRFSHGGEYLDRLARESGFTPLYRGLAPLRSEDGDPVVGHYCLLVAG